jgi:hypothetical protein
MIKAPMHCSTPFGDTSQLDWLLAEDARHGFGRDSLIVTVLGYMDEWDRTMRRFKQHEMVSDGAGSEVLHAASEPERRFTAQNDSKLHGTGSNNAGASLFSVGKRLKT